MSKRGVCFLLLLLAILYNCEKQNGNQRMVEVFDWQGHRGAKGLLPENSIAGFNKALEYPVRTLEMDCVVSKDGIVVVSHEPWMSHHICSHPNGEPVTKAAEDSLVIYRMTYEEITRYDCGSRGNSQFPDQVPTPTVKPRLSDVIQSVKSYCKVTGKTLPYFNIEIKSRPEWDREKTPEPDEFAELVLEQIHRLGIKENTCIQSFDVRSLKAVRTIDEDITIALLIGEAENLQKNLDRLGFVPDIYSPNHRLVSAHVVRSAHKKGMQVIPWTVNDVRTMKSLMDMGVDGIITDYPNRIPEAMQ